MRLRWVTSEEASCPMRSYLESYDQQSEKSKKRIDTHLARPHILLSSFPTPSESLQVPLPPHVTSKATHLNVQNITNLWMHLLSIQTQNGGFVRYDKWNESKRTKCCISQMIEDECSPIYQSFKEATPPVDEAVADLICSLPYASCNDECYKIAPSTMMPGPTSKRAMFSYGPIIPPHLMRLTDWWGGVSGILILIDVLTGQAIELKDYKPNFEDGDPHEKIMTEYNGPRKPIQELLQEWIDNFLELRWIPDGNIDIIQVESRSPIYLKYKSLLQEFNWPHSFPFSLPQMNLFLKRHYDLAKEDHSEDQRCQTLWNSLYMRWLDNNKTKGTDNVSSSEQTTSSEQRLRTLDHKIGEALRYYERREMDIAFATATDGEIEERLKAPLRLHDSANIGSDWRVDVTGHDIIERFTEVIAVADEQTPTSEEGMDDNGQVKENYNSGDNESILLEMKATMEAAYRRYLDPMEADREARMVGVKDEDDDSTEDFVDGEETDDSTGDGESGSDTMEDEKDDESEGGDDLDIEALRSDMTLDIEVIRGQLASMETDDN